MNQDNSTKQRIYKTAISLFKEKTFDGTTISDICSACDINKNLFYYYYKSKNDLLEGYRELPSDFSSEELSDILSADSYVEQLWLLFKSFIDFMVNAGVSISKQLLIQSITGDIGPFSLSDNQREKIKILQKIIAKGIESGQFQSKKTPIELLIIFHQTLMALTLRWCQKNGSFSFEDYAYYLYQLIFDVAPEYRKDVEIDFSLFRIYRNM